MKLFVKVCGVKRVEDLNAVEESGADAFGLVLGFPHSPRNIDLKLAKKLVKESSGTAAPVAVVNASDPSFVETVCSVLEPFGAQLYGADLPDLARSCGVKMVIKPVSLNTYSSLDGYDAVVVDESMGGGRALDVERCRMFVESSRLPVILSGGLNPENVAEVVRRVRPFGVDASSGLESSPGVKDRGKVMEFVRRAREAL